MPPNVCYLQEVCPHFDPGDKRKTHHARLTVPCLKFLDDSCDMSTQVRLFFGEVIACDIGKMKRLKEVISAAHQPDGV